MYRVRRVLCVEVQQCQILPEMPQADNQPTSRPAHEKKTGECYALGAKKVFVCGVFQTQKQRGNVLIPFPRKTDFNSVTKSIICTHEKTGAVANISAAASVLFLLIFRYCAIPAIQLLLGR